MANSLCRVQITVISGLFTRPRAEMGAANVVMKRHPSLVRHHSNTVKGKKKEYRRISTIRVPKEVGMGKKPFVLD